MFANDVRDTIVEVVMRFVPVVSSAILICAFTCAASVPIALSQARETRGQTPYASPVPSVVPSIAPSAIPETPSGTENPGGGNAIDALKNMIDARACVAITAVSQAVLDYPTIAEKMCELAADREYRECYKKTGGDPRVPARYTPGRFIRKCAAKRNLTLEGCAMLEDFAAAFIDGCEEGIVTLFKAEPEIDPDTGFATMHSPLY